MKKLICKNENLTKNVKELQQMGYKYIVKAQDKFLSGWGCANNKKHVQLIACRDMDQLERIKHDLYNDKTMNYVNWCYINDMQTIYNYTRNKTYTIRNDWTRCFNDLEGVL